MNNDKPLIKVADLNLFYGEFQALKNVGLEIPANAITALIGPSGCGKSTFLRCLNRMNDLIQNVRTNGSIKIDDQEILNSDIDLVALRRRVGLVFQRPNPFPLSIYENIAFGLKIHRIAKRWEIEKVVRQSLEAVLLWDVVKDKLNKNALSLTLEQQQKLCIARLLAVKPAVLLMDEPCSALDPMATLKIEELMHTLKKNYSIIIVTHNMQQAARVSDKAGFFLLGELVEFDQTNKIFTAPTDKRTEDYVTGRFG